MFGTKVFAFGALILCLALTVPPKANAEEAVATRQALELVVHVTATGLGNIVKDAPTREKQIQVIADFIKPIRFFSDSSGYFFVYDINGTCVAHATQPDIIGKDLSDLQDAHGLYVIDNLSQIAKNGGGFLEYNWKKPKATIAHDKLGYVEPIPGTDFFIGSGIYFSSLN